MDDDEDWGDGDGGGGDDDWGDDGDAGDGDGWGDDAGEGWGSDDNVQDQDQEMTIDIQIANTFYEAESDIKDNPKKALEYFHKVLELGKANAETGELNEESMDTIFKAMVLLVVLHVRSGNEEEMLKQYHDVMEYFPKVSHNESNKAVDTVLNALAAAQNTELREKVYDATVSTLSKMPNKTHMVFDIQMRRCTEYVAEQSYQKGTELLKTLHQTCTLPDGRDDQKGKGTELIDIYALEMKIAFERKIKAKTKELYEKTKNLTAAVKNPKSQSIIRECWGKMFGDDDQWQKAYAEFFVAFTTYQEAGQISNAKRCLTYVVVSNMLSGGEHNPFDSREAAVFQKDEHMQPVITLRKAYERRDVTGFSEALSDFRNSADEWILAHMDSMCADFHKQYILKFVKPYRRLRVPFLAEALKIDQDTCESYLVQLILDAKIHAKIDQVNGLLDLTQRTGGGDKKYHALEAWAGTLDQLSKSLPQPLTQSSGAQFF